MGDARGGAAGTDSTSGDLGGTLGPAIQMSTIRRTPHGSNIDEPAESEATALFRCAVRPTTLDFDLTIRT